MLTVESRLFGTRDRQQMWQFLTASKEGADDETSNTLDFFIGECRLSSRKAARLVHGTLGYMIAIAASNSDVRVSAKPTVLYNGQTTLRCCILHMTSLHPMCYLVLIQHCLCLGLLYCKLGMTMPNRGSSYYPLNRLGRQTPTYMKHCISLTRIKSSELSVAEDVDASKRNRLQLATSQARS